MTKEAILRQITQRFSEMGIPYQLGNGTDIAVNAQFLDAGWSTGKKEISYQALILADEGQKTVFMWEMTKEVSQGFSYGLDASSSFQSGRTLFRKVKSVQYGPEGKVYEISLDLGSIPKTVKEAARANGWKFKTVLKREKALYSQGYGPSPAAAPGYPPQGPAYCSSCGRPLLENASFCTECGMPVQAAASQPQTTAYPDNMISPRPKKKMRIAVLAGLAVVAVIVLAMLIMGGSDKSSGTAYLQNPQMTSGMTQDGRPVDKVTSYTPNTQQLIAVVELRQAPPDTQVRFDWVYVNSNRLITTSTASNGKKGSDIYVFSILTNQGPWPVGDYRVDMYIDGRAKPDTSVQFRVIP